MVLRAQSQSLPDCKRPQEILSLAGVKLMGAQDPSRGRSKGAQQPSYPASLEEIDIPE
jgi:hypothetical protein